MKAPTLTENFECIRQALSQFYWNNGFSTFCEVTGFDSRFQHALEKWDSFCNTVKEMHRLDDETWDKILTAALAQQATSNSKHSSN